MDARVFIKTNFDLCTGCGLCLQACSARLWGGFNPHRAALTVGHAGENLYHFPGVCNQCQNAYCARVCPVDAISRHETTGAMVVDTAKCIGCGLCQKYCPVGMIRVDRPTKKAYKCDLCGGAPSCVAACPCGALELATREPREEVAHA